MLIDTNFWLVSISIAGLLIISAFFSGSETALTGASKAKLTALKAKGSKMATRALALKENGAKEIYSYIAHGVLSGEALNRIENSAIKELVLTDSIQASNEVKNTKNIRHISIAPLMGEAIKRINSDSSVSALFD